MRRRHGRGIDGVRVELYRGWLEEGREPPPVRLIRVGDTLLVQDGRHRVSAALAAGHTVIEADVREP